MSSDITQNGVEVNDTPSNIYAYKRLSVDKLKHEYEITVSRGYMEQKMNYRLQEIAKNARLPGFRSGKTPYDFIVKSYKSKVLQYAVNNTIDYCSSDLMKKIEVQSYLYPRVDIISLPDLDKNDQKGNFVYKLSFETIPEVPTIDLDKISLKKVEAKIEEGDIREFIDSIKTKFPNLISVDDASYQAKNGDKLIINFEGRIRNKFFQGGSGRNFAFNLGSGALINGFEDELIGIKKGETKSFKLRFPENYQVISLAGQEATFSVQVSDIQVARGFESDDEVARRVGFEDYSSLVDHAKKVIGNQCKKMGDLSIKKELFDCLDASYSFDLPMDIVKREQRKVERELNSKDDSFKEAERRVKLAMLFVKFGTEHKISLTQDDVLNVILNQYVNEDVPLNRVLKHFSANREFQELVRGQALECKITDFIIEKVNKEEQVVSVKELKGLFDNV